MLYRISQFFIFLLPPEFSHHFVLQILKIVNFLNLIKPKEIPSEKPILLNGLLFKNRIGLAAGFDKNAEHINIFQNLGFGFLELGTVTPKPQPGNPKPRIHRDVNKQAIINSYGFNNVGVKKFIDNIKASNKSVILGVNIGKNAITPYEKSTDDYLTCLRQLYVHGDYIAVNISSPNTHNLRNLHNIKDLENLIEKIVNERVKLHKKFKVFKPIFIKLSPDLNLKEIKPIINLLVRHKIDGVILTNTTIDKSLVSKAYRNIPGGISGLPLNKKSEEMLINVKKVSRNKLTIISVGGIMTPRDAKRRIQLGADLIQLYTGLIYQGPLLVDAIRREL
jgi:dihydroorotate dehydrogenase